MKTTNNVQKTVKQSALIMAAIFIFGIAADAADIRTQTTVTSRSKKAFHFAIPDNAEEAALVLEDWMTGNGHFTSAKERKSDSSSATRNSVESKTQKHSFQLESHEEAPLALEPWMTGNEWWLVSR
jgi:hypothetical protein